MKNNWKYFKLEKLLLISNYVPSLKSVATLPKEHTQKICAWTFHDPEAMPEVEGEGGGSGGGFFSNKVRLNLACKKTIR